MKVLRKMVGAVLILSAMAGVAQAYPGVDGGGGCGSLGCGDGGNVVHEIGLGTSGSALTVLAGGLLILRDRFRSK